MTNVVKGNLDMSGWTIETLKEHLEKIFEERDKRHDERFDAQEKATQKAFESAEKATLKAEEQTREWKASANEWRDAMNDREIRFTPTPAHDALAEKVADLALRMKGAESRSVGLQTGWNNLATGINVTATIISLIAAFFILK